MKYKSEKIGHNWNRKSDVVRSDVFGARYRIRMLLKEQKMMRFTDLQRKMKLSNNVLSKHLKKMKNDGEVLSKKDGREVHYALSQNKSVFPEVYISLFYEAMFEYIEIRMNEISSDNNKIFLKQLAEKIAPLLIFSVIHSVKTGHDFTKYLNSQEFSRFILYTIIRHLYKGEIPDFLARYTENYPEQVDYYGISELLMKNSAKTNTKFKKLFQDLEKTFFEEIEVMKYVYIDPFERSWLTAVNKLKI